MENLRVVPYLYQYVKTNRFTGLFIGLVLFFIALGFTPAATKFKSFVEAKKSRRIGILLGVLVLGCALRLFWVDLCPYRPAFSWEAGKEEGALLMEYDGINIYATSALKGEWFRDERGMPQARRPIGYPLFLSLFYKIFGPSYTVMYTVDLTLICLMIVSVYWMASRLFGAAPGLLAAFFLSIYPPSVYSLILPMDELLFMPLWYFGLCLLFRQLEGNPVRWSLLWYGLIFGYATMTRTQTIFMPLVVGFAYFLLKMPKRKVFFAVIVTGLISFTLTLPWIARNYKYFGAVIPYAAPSVEFYPFNNASVTHGERASWPKPGQENYEISQTLLAAKHNVDLKTMQQLSKKLMVEYILKHPIHFLMSGTERVLFLFAADRSRGVWAIDIVQTGAQHRPDKALTPQVENIAEEMAFAAYYFVLYAFICGMVWLVLSWRKFNESRKNLFLTLGLCFLFYVAEQYIVFPERRYRYPLEPFMLIVGAAWLFSLAERGNKKLKAG